MTLPPEDRDLIERVLGYDADENVKTLLLTPSDLAKLFAAVRAEAAPSSPGDGWVMVPIVPRDEMVRAGDAVLAQSTWPDADDIWTAMIDARPLPTEGEGVR